MTPHPTRQRRRPSTPLLAAAALLAGAVGAGGTFALWSSDDVRPLGQVVAGNLAVELTGAPLWQETSPDVAGTPHEINAADFLARPGDTLTMSQQFTTELQGDNMLGRITVDWEGAATIPDGVTATYSVRDAAGTPVVADLPLGQPATLPAIDTDDAGRSDAYSLEVDIALAATGADRFGAEAPAQIADLGTITLQLDQVRTGEGFTS